MTRARHLLFGLWFVAALGSLLSACGPPPSTSPESLDEQCRWGVGCQARCAQGYEHRIPYCGGGGF
jgi:hypothetical protein